MRRNPWIAVPATAVLCFGLAPLVTVAQRAASSSPPVLTAHVEFPAPVGPETSPNTPGSDKSDKADKSDPSTANAAPATTPAAANATTPGPSAPGATPANAASGNAAPGASVAVPLSNDAVIKELVEMKARIAQLEAELKARSGAADAERDANALRTAESEDGVTPAGSLPAGQAAATPAPLPAAAPAPPEIAAEITTKSAPWPGDWTWTNDGGHNTDSPMSTKYFTPEIRFDANYILDYNHPEDDSMVGSTEMYRAEEWQLEQASVGGDFRIQNTRGRILTMNGLFSQATVRNDASYNRGQWDLKDAYKYFSEAWGGYHWDVAHGLNVDAGIFVSYVGLFSYYNFDNWAYQPSYVSSNTPWFFNGVRIQYFVTDKLKIEPWIINGWQSYARYNGHGGLGGQIMWRPTPKLDFNFNDYGLGEDDAGFPGRSRVHADYSGQFKLYDNPKNFLDKWAFTITGDAGCEYGGGPASFAVTGQTKRDPTGASPMRGTLSTYNGGVDCHSSKDGRPKQMFVGWMAYTRAWFKKDLYAVTLGGGQMNNPGRYLTLLPAINGATATSGTPYFTENAGDRAQAHDMTATFDYMPSQFITFRLEEAYRYSGVPYWSGRGGVTPPGGNNGNPADYQCAAGGDSGYGYVYTNTTTGVGVPGQPLAIQNCHNLNLDNGQKGQNALWWPDLRTNQTTTLLAIMVRF
jgi:hypothetical protein